MNAIDHFIDPQSPINYVEYSSLVELEADVFGLTVEELREGDVEGEDAAGHIETMPFEEYEKLIHRQGFMAYSSPEDRTVRFWQNDLSDEALLRCLGHEVGHLVGEPLDDPMAEEARADRFAWAVLETYRAARRVVTGE